MARTLDDKFYEATNAVVEIKGLVTCNASMGRVLSDRSYSEALKPKGTENITKAKEDSLDIDRD